MAKIHFSIEADSKSATQAVSELAKEATAASESVKEIGDASVVAERKAVQSFGNLRGASNRLNAGVTAVGPSVSALGGAMDGMGTTARTAFATASHGARAFGAAVTAGLGPLGLALTAVSVLTPALIRLAQAHFEVARAVGSQSAQYDAMIARTREALQTENDRLLTERAEALDAANKLEERRNSLLRVQQEMTDAIQRNEATASRARGRTAREAEQNATRIRSDLQAVSRELTGMDDNIEALILRAENLGVVIRESLESAVTMPDADSAGAQARDMGPMRDALEAQADALRRSLLDGEQRYHEDLARVTELFGSERVGAEADIGALLADVQSARLDSMTERELARHSEMLEALRTLYQTRGEATLIAEQRDAAEGELARLAQVEAKNLAEKAARADAAFLADMERRREAQDTLLAMMERDAFTELALAEQIASTRAALAQLGITGEINIADQRRAIAEQLQLDLTDTERQGLEDRYRLLTEFAALTDAQSRTQAAAMQRVASSAGDALGRIGGAVARAEKDRGDAAREEVAAVLSAQGQAAIAAGGIDLASGNFVMATAKIAAGTAALAVATKISPRGGTRAAAPSAPSAAPTTNNTVSISIDASRFADPQASRLAVASAMQDVFDRGLVRA